MGATVDSFPKAGNCRCLAENQYANFIRSRSNALHSGRTRLKGKLIRKCLNGGRAVFAGSVSVCQPWAGHYSRRMNKKIFAALTLLCLAFAVRAEWTNAFPLWPEGAPGALGTNSDDIPTLTTFLPATTNASVAAMLICPGGGYGHLATNHEGELYARWFNERGVAGFVLKYRLGPRYHHPAMLQDASRALRIIRARAAGWNIDPERIGVIGSSAGGHLASTLMTHYDEGDTNATDAIERASSRPALGVLCYPVISMNPKITHHGSYINLLGSNPPPDLVAEFSNELQVTTNTPPCFIWTTADDKTVQARNSLLFAEALGAARVPFELHVYESGRHGQGLGSKEWQPEKFLPWTRELERWLKTRGFIAGGAG